MGSLDQRRGVYGALLAPRRVGPEKAIGNPLFREGHREGHRGTYVAGALHVTPEQGLTGLPLQTQRSYDLEPKMIGLTTGHIL